MIELAPNTDIPVWISYLAVVGLMLAGLATLWLSASRISFGRKSRLISVWGLNLLAFAAVIGLITNPQYQTEEIATAVLITTGSEAHQLKQITATDKPVFSMADWATQADNSELIKGAEIIDDPAQLLQLMPELQSVRVLGDGLTSQQWQSLSLLSQSSHRVRPAVHFEPSQKRIGPVQMAWQKQLSVGEVVELTGTLQGDDEHINSSDIQRIYQLDLLDPGNQPIETLRLKQGDAFRFKFAAKAQGLWVYKLQLTDPGNQQVMANEPVAFEVKPLTAPAMLIQQSSPSFETRHLKNWASQFGSRITVVSQISKNNAVVQHINFNQQQTSQSQVTPFMGQTLHNYDFLIMDGRAFSGLSDSERDYLHASVKNGLGLLLLADKDLVSSFEKRPVDWLNAIELSPEVDSNRNNQTLPSWHNNQIKQPVSYLNANLHTHQGQVLLRGDENQSLLVSHNIGLGKVGISLFSSSYQWQLSGLQSSYSHYWQTLITKLGRNHKGNAWIPAETGEITYLGQPHTICALLTTELVKAYQLSVGALKLTPSLFQPNKMCSTFWPDKTGWQTFSLTGNNKQSGDLTNLAENVLDRQSYYVFKQSDWDSWQQAEKHHSTAQAARQSITPTPTLAFKAVSKLYFWWLLFISATLLWIERKMF